MMELGWTRSKSASRTHAGPRLAVFLPSLWAARSKFPIKQANILPPKLRIREAAGTEVSPCVPLLEVTILQSRFLRPLKTT